jgi:prepilin-type N-terminal cleavage/methylation domain-containing protein
MTLIELLVAMVVLSIGITALVAGFSSGVFATDRARAASTAATLADEKMELYRQASFASLPTNGPLAPTTPTGPDGRSYSMQVEGAWTCALDPATTTTGPTPPPCPGPPVSRAVKLVTITVQDPATAKVLFTESATFDSSTG